MTPKYLQYLASPAWARKRRLVFIRDRGICQACMYGRAEHVHHLTYARIFREDLEDLISLCDYCHRKKHGIEVKPLLELGVAA